MPIDITSIQNISGLKPLAVKQLRTFYSQIIGCPPPRFASREYLTGSLAWALQAKQQKKNPDVLRDQILNRSDPSKRNHKKTYRPGTRLVREWHGETYEITITDKGYLWQNQHYRSLTAIAREITGAGWSGPRFFGLIGGVK